MTDAALAPAAPAAAASDLPNGGTAPQAPAAPAYRPIGFPETPAAFDAPEAVAAREEIKAKIGDKEFYKSLISERERGVAGPASQLWDRLHKAGHPSPTGVTSQADVNVQANARNAEMWDGYIAALKQRSALTAEQEAEIRSGVVHESAYAWAREEKDRLIKDRGWYRRLLDGDRQANRDWTLVTSILSLRPVKR
jgi:hypothetical protein